jgi:hypothetical protein
MGDEEIFPVPDRVFFLPLCSSPWFMILSKFTSVSFSDIPQSGDLCDGTGGNGQIVSVGNNEFTIKRNDDGSDQVIHLTGQAAIQTSAGSASLSDMKIGYRVTLVGGPNPDGSFNADTVVVYNGIVP